MSPRRDAVPWWHSSLLHFLDSVWAKIVRKNYMQPLCLLWGRKCVHYLTRSTSSTAPKPIFFYDILSRLPAPPPPSHCVSKFCFGWYLKISRLRREMGSFEFMRVLFFTFWFWANAFSEKNHNVPMIHNLSPPRWSLWECTECFCIPFMCLMWISG